MCKVSELSNYTRGPEPSREARAVMSNGISLSIQLILHTAFDVSRHLRVCLINTNCNV